MLGIKIKDTFISLYDNTQLNFDIRNPIGIITDALDNIQGGYSFPIDIPLDVINREVIGHVDRLDLDGTLMQQEYCEVWARGLFLMQGKATIKQSSKQLLSGHASLFMVFNPVTELTDVMMTDIDLGGVRTIGADAATRLAHADDTLSDPLDHHYIFAPIYNPVYRALWDAGFPTAQQRHYQNFWSSDDDAFDEYAVSGITPFVRLDYLLKRIFAHMGYTLDDQWLTTDELKQLLIYNNYNINTHTAAAISSWDETIDLRHHVPLRQALDLIKGIIGTYALGLFPEPADKVMRLIPFKTLITGDVAADWTSLAAVAYECTTDRNFIARWRYDLDEHDAMSVRYSGAPYPQQIVLGEGLTCRIMFDAGQFLFRYSICDNTYYHILPIPGLNADYIAQDMKEVRKTGSDMEYISPLIPLWNSHDIETDGDENDDLPIQQQQLCAIEHVGFIKESGDALQPCTSLRLFFYRGFQPYDVGISGTYPMTGITRYNIRGEQVGDYALTWDRPGGVYDAWWKLPYEMLKNKKVVTRSLNLSIADLINFRFHHKIRIENQHYFITRLKYSISNRGLGITEAEMITTI